MIPSGPNRELQTENSIYSKGTRDGFFVPFSEDINCPRGVRQEVAPSLAAPRPHRGQSTGWQFHESHGFLTEMRVAR